MVPSKWPFSTLVRKFFTVSGAFSSSSSRRIVPLLVSRSTSLVTSFLHGCLFDDDRRQGHVAGAGGHGADLVDHVHALDDLAEDRVAVAVARLRLVQEVIVLDVDEELRGCGIGIVRPRHGDGA